MSCTSLMLTATALVAYNLAEDKSLATLPLAINFIATMLTTIPAALLMKYIGRKAGFILATGFGVISGSLAAWSIIEHSFWGFTASAAFIGMHNGFASYYRFAAADAVAPHLKGRAVSYIMAGGVIAAFIGPNLANYCKDWISYAPFAGSYAALVLLYVLSSISLSFLKLPKDVEDDMDTSIAARPLSIIVKQPRFIVAVICGAFGYGVMSLIMTATPLAMNHHAHAFSETSFVIQWHVLAMFAPSFFTGYWIERFGLKTLLNIGALLGIGCVGINLLGTSVWHFWFSLFFLGLSWNFLFIGGTALLTQTYQANERAKVQATNDFIVFSTVTLSSLSAGVLQHKFGWQAVNIGVLPLLGIVIISVLMMNYRSNAKSSSQCVSDCP